MLLVLPQVLLRTYLNRLMDLLVLELEVVFAVVCEEFESTDLVVGEWKEIRSKL